MGQPDGPLTHLGRTMAEAEDALRPTVDFVQGRTRLLAASRVQSRRQVRPFMVSLVAAALVAASVVLVVVLQRPQALTFRLGPGEQGAVGEWIAAPPSTG